MVVTAFWMPSWSVSVISVSILVVVVALLICCLCIQKKRTEALNFSVPSHRKLVNLSSTSLNKLFTFRYFDSKISENVPDFQKKRGSQSELLESADITERFTSSRLKIADLESLDRDELASCGSADSMFTFYSTYPARSKPDSNSDSGTYKSTRNSTGKIPKFQSSRSFSNLCVV